MDVGFGDPLVPGPMWLDYPTLLAGPAVRVRACRPETQAAWKLHGLAEMGAGWRPKDLADLWLIATRVPLEADLLPPAIEAAFVSRGCRVEDAVRLFDLSHWTTKTARVRWNAHRGRLPELPEVVAEVLAAGSARHWQRWLADFPEILAPFHGVHAVSAVNPLMPAVLANPEDDTPRLICADWLEEHGDEARGQFIRAQCELARLPAWDRRRQALTWLADDLRAGMAPAGGPNCPCWKASAGASSSAASCPRCRSATPSALPPRRGHRRGRPGPPRGAVLAGRRRQAPGERGAPRPREVRLVGYGTRRERADASFLRGVAVLEFLNFPQYGGLGYPQDGPLEWVLAHADPATLTSLKVEGSHVIGRPFARELAMRSRFSRLARLGLGTRFIDHNTGYFEDPTLGADGAADLAGSSSLSALTALDLNRQRIGDAGLDSLLSSPSLRGLQELELRSNEIASVIRFGSSQGAGFVRLDLGGNAIGDAGAAALAAAPRLAGLASLGLDTCEIGSRGIQALTSAPFWATLDRLDLGQNPLGEQGTRALAAAGLPARLHALRLSDCDLDDTAAEVLAAIPWLAGLQSLDLSGNQLKEGGTLLLDSAWRTSPCASCPWRTRACGTGPCGP